jgi:hypothetical protein
MVMMTTNTKWLIGLSAVILVVASLIFMRGTQENHESKMGDSISDIAKSADDGAKELKEEIIDEIDDNTTDRK